jgi:hypothetical protein
MAKDDSLSDQRLIFNVQKPVEAYIETRDYPFCDPVPLWTKRENIKGGMT